MFGGLVLCLASASCAPPPLSAAGSRVTASESPPPTNCADLGDVFGHASQSWGARVDSGVMVGAALDAVRSNAGARGADYVQVGKPQLGSAGGATHYASFGGRAYRCARARNSRANG